MTFFNYYFLACYGDNHMQNVEILKYYISPFMQQSFCQIFASSLIIDCLMQWLKIGYLFLIRI